MRDWAARNRDTSRSIKARWAANNIGYVNAKTATRRIARVRATPQWVPVEAFKPIYDAARVASELTGEACHVDHIVPSQGKGVSGLHVPWNLRVIFAKDNLSKGAKFIEELVA
ncbi:hypothetical protein SAMN05660652_01454 [Propionivibrio dicarboxylicus]|uniref:Uncharacterized protein n=2 Tax=Propionivibrio dicarboxylicus TaxID=83767 RepID=A0A1G8APG4_9RHOO|nr:hypothetical protein SAMN05660652_01454 [Propionivibrio dicarboxylicus]